MGCGGVRCYDEGSGSDVITQAVGLNGALWYSRGAVAILCYTESGLTLGGGTESGSDLITWRVSLHGCGVVQYRER
jgi:hypothetical protein